MVRTIQNSKSKIQNRTGDIQVCDFSRSFLRWRIDTTKKDALTASHKLPMTLNNVRVPLECRTLITDEAAGTSREFVLCASCKSERVWVDSDIWTQPNSDMCMWASSDGFVVCKQWDKVDKGVMLYPETLGPQPEKHLGDPAEAFDRFSIDITLCGGQIMENAEEINDVLFSNKPVISQTEYRVGGYRVLLEYPVKAVNFSERERYYQVDTGPVLLPDFTSTDESLIRSCRLAYVAHHRPDWTEFIVNVHTPLTDNLKVHHYSQAERMDGVINRMIVLSN